MNVLIVGARGNLGQDLVVAFVNAGHMVAGVDREELDITNETAVQTFFAAHSFDVIVNAAAFNNVDACEDPAVYPTAYAVNTLGPKYLAQAAKEMGARFVHYSTDYVFPGEKPEGYSEDDAPNPISKYGETKLAGERLVAEVGGAFYLCRLSKIFGKPGSSEVAKPSFVHIMMRLAKTKPELAIVDEEVGSPSYTADIAQATVRLVSEAFAPGIYHLVNEGSGVTWFGFAESFFAIAGITTARRPVSSAEFPKPAKRPKFAALRNTKFPPLPTRDDALRRFFAASDTGLAS